MKNLSLILNIVLFLAVGFLYIQFYSGKSDKATGENQDETTEAGPLKIAYINADSVLLKYEYFRTQSEILAQKEKEADASLQAKGRAFEREMQQVQQKMQQGLLAPSDIQKEEQRLGQKQQQLVQERDQVAQSLLQESQKVNKILQDNLMGELNKIKDAEGYDLILSYTAGGQVLLADESMDITERVLTALNAIDPAAADKQ